MTRLVSIVFLAMLGGLAHAADRDLDATALSEALAIGHTSAEAPRSRFHAPYRVPVGRAPIDYLDLVTPFRAVVLAAEARTSAGASTLGMREAREIAAATGYRTAVQIELTFHPMNNFIGVPPYSVEIVSKGMPIPLPTERVPRFGPRVAGSPVGVTPGQGGAAGALGGSQPLTGGTLLGRLPEDVDPRSRFDLLIKDGPRVLARVLVDLARVR